MRTSIRIAALLLSGAVFMGCDNKDNTTVAPPQTVTPPAAPDTSKITDAAKNAVDTAKTDAKNATDAAKTDAKNATDAAKTGIQNAADAAKTEANKVMPASMPSMPGMK